MANTKTWVVNSETSRHPELDGETVPLDGSFSNGMSYPGDPAGGLEQTAGCTCTMDVNLDDAPALNVDNAMSTEFQSYVGRPLTQVDMDRRNQLVGLMRRDALTKYEAVAGKIDDVAAPAAELEAPTTRLIGTADPKMRDLYVADDAKTLLYNQRLRSGETSFSWASRMDKYTASSEVGADAVLHRSAILPPDMVARLRPGTTFTDNAFMSTSPNVSAAKGYANARSLDLAFEGSYGGQVVQFEMRVSAGQRLGVMDSSEFVLPRNTTMRVLGVTKDTEGVFQVVVQVG